MAARYSGSGEVLHTFCGQLCVQGAWKSCKSLKGKAISYLPNFVAARAKTAGNWKIYFLV
ncbi:hypothetical protein [Massilia sp. TWP1-3-3]|uniref:hypothetical protein n=1 Tax=Massilia sp. TWP1-3-3 TaxID=2804573 RepID=UPI003CF074AA